jgi:hypothetical protein
VSSVITSETSVVIALAVLLLVVVHLS